MPKRSTSLSLDAALLDEARALKINVSRAAQEGVDAAVREARAAAWKKENAEAIRAYNDYIEKNGLPLQEYRSFNW